jgi:hypothetical protein
MVHIAGRELWNDRRLTLQQMLQRHPQGITEKGHGLKPGRDAMPRALIVPDGICAAMLWHCPSVHSQALPLLPIPGLTWRRQRHKLICSSHLLRVLNLWMSLELALTVSSSDSIVLT